MSSEFRGNADYRETNFKLECIINWLRIVSKLQYGKDERSVKRGIYIISS